MDKRKQKLFLQFSQIVDEQNTLKESIEKVVSQLKTFVGNCDGEQDQKQVQAVLHYEIQLLQKLTDINFELETLLSENPLDGVSQIEPVANNQSNGAINTSPSSTSEPNIQALKNNFLEFSKKLGINDNSLTSIKDYYAKPSTSITEMTTESKCSNYDVGEMQLVSNTSDTDLDWTESASHSTTNKKKPEFNEKVCNLKDSEQNSDFIVDLKLKPEENLVRDTPKPRSTIEIKDKDPPATGTQCAFTHIESPHEFYLHLIDDDCHYIDDMPNLIASEISKNSLQFRSKEEAHAYIDKYCFAMVKKDWYRAEVLDWNLDKKADDVKVQLIDFGNKELVSYRKIRVLTEKFTKIPKIALRCHLPFLYPIDYSIHNRKIKWSSDVIKTFLTIAGLVPTNHSDVTLFVLDYVAKRGKSFAVELHEIHEDADNAVGAILLQLNQAKEIIDPLSDDLELEEFLQDYDTEEPENVNEAIVGYDAKDEARICRFTRPDGTCFKGQNCHLEHTPHAKDGFTTDVIPVYHEAFTELLLPQKTDTLYILITWYINSCAFYAQIIRTHCKNTNYIMDMDLKRLLQTINQPKNVRKYVKHKVPPGIGEVVLVQHWTGHWLRAVVRELIGNERSDFAEAQVFLVDYGEVLEVKAKDIREIKEEYLQLPFQAIECYLHNVQEKKNVDKERARRFFKENIENRNFVAQIMSDTVPMRMAVMSLNGLDIAEKLIELDLAEPRLDNVQPADDAKIRPN